jgi:hypothetical protein
MHLICVAMHLKRKRTFTPFNGGKCKGRFPEIARAKEKAKEKATDTGPRMATARSSGTAIVTCVAAEGTRPTFARRANRYVQI